MSMAVHGVRVPLKMSVYPMDREKRGLVVFINNYKFMAVSGFGDRIGWQHDRDHIEQCLVTGLQYDWVYKENLTKEALTDYCKELGVADLSMYSSVIFILSTHGECNGLVWATDKAVRLRVITRPLRENISMEHRPKIIITDACRGTLLLGADASLHPDIEHPPKYPAIASEADCLWAFSTPPGFVSWETSNDGSPYMSYLCANVNTYAHIETFDAILKRVTADVAHNFETRLTKNQLFKQLPSFTHQLLREFYLV